MRPITLLLTFALAAAPGAAQVSAPPPSPAERLHDLFEREWRLRLEESPLLATSVGVHDYDDRLADVSPAALERAAEARRAFLAELRAIDPQELDTQDRISWRIFEAQMEDEIASWEHGHWQIPFTTDTGFHVSLPFVPREMPFRTAADYERYIARLRAVPAYFGQQTANLRRGLERGMTQPRAILAPMAGTMTAHVVDDPRRSVFFAPFERLPATLPAAERERLAAAGEAAIREAVVPAYAELARFFTEDYLPGARETLGATELPGGEEYYAWLVRHYTTLDQTPEEIHRLGLAEVARIRSEMDAVIEEVGFEGDFAAFLAFLRTDPQFYAATPEALLERAAWIAKKADGALPGLFATLPRQPYTVEPVPPHLAPNYTAGRYVGAAPDSGQPGIYWVNTHDLPSRPLYALEALTLHEAVPGHHLQNALAQELEDLPDFRQYLYLSAFGEGWGLYSEWLGVEAGFYQDPYSRFGRLTYEMWRACRLVVDTGLHAMGWSRQRAVDYLAGNTALSLHEVATEIDRYISWPAQALAYKMGELEIKRLRAEAEAALGDRFDVRTFHDAVLLNGSVPLPVLAEQVADYIAARRAEAGR